MTEHNNDLRINRDGEKIIGELKQEIVVTTKLPLRYRLMIWWFIVEIGFLCCLMYRILMKLDKFVG